MKFKLISCKACTKDGAANGNFLSKLQNKSEVIVPKGIFGDTVNTKQKTYYVFGIKDLSKAIGKALEMNIPEWDIQLRFDQHGNVLKYLYEHLGEGATTGKIINEGNPVPHKTEAEKAAAQASTQDVFIDDAPF